MLARRPPVLGVGAVAPAVRLYVVELGAAGDDSKAVVFDLYMAALRQRQRLAEPLGVMLRAQRLGSLRTEALPGKQGVVFVAVQGGDVLGHAGGNGVWYTSHRKAPRHEG